MSGRNVNRIACNLKRSPIAPTIMPWTSNTRRLYMDSYILGAINLGLHALVLDDEVAANDTRIYPMDASAIR